VLVFLDADTRPAPGFIAHMAALAHSLGGMVSVQPRHRTVRAYEQLSAVANVVALMSGTGTVQDGDRTWWQGPVGFGPAMAVPARQYRQAGGHQRVRDAIAEDLALASVIRAAGLPVAAYLPGRGPGAIDYRMYPLGLADLVEGWTKNLAAGARSVPPLRAAAIGLWVTSSAAAGLRATRSPFTYALFAVQMAVLMRRAGQFFAATSLCYPLPLAAFIVLFGLSGAGKLTGATVAWRGRRLQP
jgi:4,4'-diaponeurosporenoate glycosyltransferase